MVWHFGAFLKSYGIFSQNTDLSVNAKQGLMIAIFVDEFFILGVSISEIKAAKVAFQTLFRMLNLGLCKFYLGMTAT